MENKPDGGPADVDRERDRRRQKAERSLQSLEKTRRLLVVNGDKILRRNSIRTQRTYDGSNLDTFLRQWDLNSSVIKQTVPPGSGVDC